MYVCMYSCLSRWFDLIDVAFANELFFAFRNMVKMALALLVYVQWSNVCMYACMHALSNLICSINLRMIPFRRQAVQPAEPKE